MLIGSVTNLWRIQKIETFVANGRLTIVKKVEGAAQGLLRHVKGNPSITDRESLEDALDS